MLGGECVSDLYTHYPDFFSRYRTEFESSTSDTLSSPKKAGDTMSRFGYEWTAFADYDCDNFTPFISPLPEGFFNKKLGLDIGCGAGRHVQRAAEEGAEIVGIDLSFSVDSAYTRNMGNERVHIVQADIFNLPFDQGTFDFIYSLGVLQHIPDPRGGYTGLVPYLKKGGALFVWIYARRFRKVALESLRFFAQRLSNRNIQRMAFVCNLFDYGIGVTVYKLLCRIPAVGNCVQRIAPLRVKEYAEHGYKVSYTDWFDRLSAPITNYYKEKEAREWLALSGLHNPRLLPEGDSWWWLYGERDPSR
jgi:SAM-dependent methyltransferase